MVKGMAVNGYQMVNRADAGGKYQGTWQTATANWITIVRKDRHYSETAQGRDINSLKAATSFTLVAAY